jgi:hypothetical protein
MVLFALMLPVLLGSIALVLDIGNGYVARRDLQNAADLGSLAVAQYLGDHSTPTDRQVAGIVTDFVTANAPISGATWVATYIKDDGTSTGIAVNNVGHIVPPGAAGVLITPSVQSHNFFEQVLGSKVINVSASGGAVGAINSSTGGAAIGGSSAPAIVALDSGNHICPHSIISDANGTYTDVVDAKEGGTMNIAGQFITASPSPFDGHFRGNVGSNVAYGMYSSGTTTINYGSLATGHAYYPDPLAKIAEPVNASAACSGGTATVNTQASFANGVWTPGIYQGNSNGPAIFTGITILNDCGNSVAGVYIFPHGAVFEGTLTGNDVLLYSQGQINPSNVCTDNSQANNGGALLNEPYIGSSSGVNVYGFIFTGPNSVTLSAPNSGPFTNLVLFQSRSAPAHIGFKVCPGDSGVIALIGTVYAHNQNDVPRNSRNTVAVTNTSWSPAGNGSALVFGTDDGAMDGNGTPPSCATDDPPTCTWPTYGGGTLKIDGAAVVDVFYTTGNANVTIMYDTSHVPLVGAKLIH